MDVLSPTKLLEGFTFLFLAFVVCVPFRWQTLLKAVLVIVVVEGAVRKWLLPGLSQFVYFAKDFIVVIVYCKFLAERAGDRSPLVRDKVLGMLIILTGVVVLLQISNPSVGSIILGLIGARNYLLYIPLLFICEEFFKSEEELARFIRRYLLLIFPIMVLATLQHYAPADSGLNMYVSGEDTAFAMIGQRARVTGTFSYIAGFAAYLQTMASLVVPLLILKHSTRWNITFRAILMSIVIGILFTGSRTPVMTTVLFFLGYFLLNRVFRSLGLYKKLVALGVVIALFAFIAFGSTFWSFFHRFTTDEHLSMRMLAAVTTPFGYIVHAGLTGYGTGSAFQGADKIKDILGVKERSQIPVFFESEPERIMLELGVVGFMLWYLLRIRIIVCLWQVYTSLNRPLLRELALTAMLIHALTFVGQVVFQITFNVYFWFLAGFIYLLPRLELEAESDEEESEDNEGTTSDELDENNWNLEEEWEDRA